MRIPNVPDVKNMRKKWGKTKVPTRSYFGAYWWCAKFAI